MEESSGEAMAPSLTIALDPPVMVNKIAFAELVLGEPTLAQVTTAVSKLDDAVAPSIASQREYEMTLVAVVAGKGGRPMVDEIPSRPLRQAVAYLERWILEPIPAEPPEGDELVLEFDPPLSANGGHVAEITLREPKAGELFKAEQLLGKGGIPLPGPVRRYQAKLIELVSGLGPLVVGQIPIGKAKEAVRFLEGFEQSARATGRR